LDKIILNIEQVNKLLAWRDKHIELVRDYHTIITDGEIYVEDTKKSMRFKVDHPFINFDVPQGFTARIEVLDDIQRYRIVTASIEDHGLITDTIALYFAVTSYIYFYQPEIRTRQFSYRETRYSNEKRTNIKVITIKGIIYTLPDKINVNRRPPQRIAESWNVRGHARHMANGKVVYVKPYTKGHGKAIDKTYKIKP
jgi:hypothetical protein